MNVLQLPRPRKYSYISEVVKKADLKVSFFFK